MLKKQIVSLLIPFMLFALLTPNMAPAAHAATIDIQDGKIVEGRMLIPLRLLSEELGANVDWNQKLKKITIKGERITHLTLNSRVVIVNDSKFLIDIPVQAYNGKTYVPLRFASQALGAKIGWDQQAKQATITKSGKQIVIHGTQSESAIKANRVSVDRVNLLAQKMNEATDLSSISQIRTYFKPYFTDGFINKLIARKGLEYDYQFKDNSTFVSYNSDTIALFPQTSEFDKDGEYEAGDYFLYRTVVLVLVNGVWKVDKMNYNLTERRY